MRSFLFPSVLLAALTVPVGASASTINVTFTDVLDGQASAFSFDSTAAFYASGPGHLGQVAYANSLPAPNPTYIDFTDTADFSGEDLFINDYTLSFGAQLYDPGSYQNPVFYDGVYILSVPDGSTATLTISGAAAPEPSSLVLLGTGLMTLLVTAPRKFRKA